MASALARAARPAALSRLSAEALELALRSAALHLQSRDGEVDGRRLEQEVGSQLAEGVSLQQVLKVCCALLRRTGRKGGMSDEQLAERLTPLGFSPAQVKLLAAVLQWVRDGSPADASRLSPPSSPTQEPAIGRRGETRCPVPPMIADPLQHAPLQGTRVGVTRRGCVRAVPAAPVSSARQQSEDGDTDDGVAETKTYLASSQVGGQIALARRALIEVSRNTELGIWNGKGINRETALLLAEEATIEAQLAVLDARPGPHVERLRREEGDLLALFDTVSADKAHEEPAILAAQKPAVAAAAHVGYRKRVASLRTFLSVPTAEAFGVASRQRNVFGGSLEEL